MSGFKEEKGSIFNSDTLKEKLLVTVSDDFQSAWIEVPENPKDDDVFLLLEEAGVVSGIEKTLVSEINKKIKNGEKTESRYLVAKGSRPVNGQPGELILRTKKPEEIILSSEDLSRVDYRVYKSKQLSLAEKEKPVAMIISPTKGRDGLDVSGQVLPGEDGEEVVLVLGKNVYQNGKKIISTIDGLLEYKLDRDGKIYIDVSEVYLVKGDVDFSTGNIDFPGSVVVKGSIKAGFEVKAKGEVVADTIRGKVFSGGAVVAKQGIIGGTERTHIEAKGSVYAKFVQFAHIVTDESVIIKKAIINSNIYAEIDIEVEGTPGSVIGGSLFAVNRISAKVFGSESYVKTEAAIFESAKGVIEMKKIVEERFSISKNLLRIETYLGQNRNMLFEGLEEDKRSLVNKLMEKRDQLRAQLLEKNGELKLIQAKMSVPAAGTIEVSKEIWPEVKVLISGKYIIVKELRKKGRFYYDTANDTLEFGN